MRIGNAAKVAIGQRYNTQFTVGNIVDLLCKWNSERSVVKILFYPTISSLSFF